MEISMEAPRKIKIELPYGYIPLWYLKELKANYYRNTCMLMFMAAQFTIAKTWNKPGCLPRNEQIKKMWYIQQNRALLHHNEE